MQDIKDLSLDELTDFFKQRSIPQYRARQVFSWIYKKGAQSFDQMSDLSSSLRNRLKEDFFLFSLELINSEKSRDKTTKFLFALKDKNLIEAVIIPTEKRITGCVSTQAGCRFGCKFCASGISGFKRNLSVGEIIEEVLLLKKNSKDKKLTHIVFMGIGEPLDNYDNTLKAIRIINSPNALNIGARRITISTAGIIPGIKRLSDENLQVELSVSLHAADDEVRTALMPVNKIYPLKDLLGTCRDYIVKTGRQITFEYVLIKGVNSDLQNARNLCTILKSLRLCKVNLIPANIVKEYRIEPPNKLDILLFRDHLLKDGINVTLRKPRGEDIAAACGQLRARYERL